MPTQNDEVAYWTRPKKRRFGPLSISLGVLGIVLVIAAFFWMMNNADAKMKREIEAINISSLVPTARAHDADQLRSDAHDLCKMSGYDGTNVCADRLVERATSLVANEKL